MYKIAVIGAGAIGKRHLESLLHLDASAYQIYVIDKNPEIISSVTVPGGSNVVTGTDCGILPKQLDAAVIATTSAVRKDAFLQLMESCQVTYIIFEKVLFQRKADYTEVETLLKDKGIKAWVNCARREYGSYKDLKQMLEKTDYFTFSLTGSNWGMGCNGIHMLDVVQYLSGDDRLRIDHTNFLPFLEDSRRKGYKEFYGSITGNCGKCIRFSINCLKDGALPFVIDIAGSDFHYSIMEPKQKMYYMDGKNGWILQEHDFPVVFQSQLTQRVVERILFEGKCSLPAYEESMRLHMTFMDSLSDFFERYGVEKGLCPIT